MTSAATRKLNAFLSGSSPSEYLTTFSSSPHAKQCVDTKIVRCNYNKGHAMCMAYKAIDPDTHKLVCNSSRFDNIKEVRLSGPAEYIYMPRLSSIHLREMSVEDVNLELKASAICTACTKDEVLRPFYNRFVNIFRSPNLCGICKEPHNRHVEDNIAMCKICKEALAGETAMYIGLKALDMVFSPMGIDIIDMRGSGRCSSSSRTVFPDCEIRVMKGPGNTILLFIIEQDEDQHNKEKQRAEHEKMLNQAAEALADLFSTLRPEDYKRVKIILVRFSPTGNYKVNNDTFGENHGRAYRIIVLRQWIIWAILNAERLGPLNMWYMYYNNTKKDKAKDTRDNKRPTLMFNEWPGFAMMNEAPQADNPAHNWKYCLVPYEGDTRSCRGANGTAKKPKKKKKGKKAKADAEVDDMFTGKPGDGNANGKMFKKMVDRRVNADDVFKEGHGWRWDVQGPKMPQILRDAVEVIMMNRDSR